MKNNPCLIIENKIIRKSYNIRIVLYDNNNNMQVNLHVSEMVLPRTVYSAFVVNLSYLDAIKLSILVQDCSE